MAVQHVQRRTMGSRRGFGCGHARLASGIAEMVNTVYTNKPCVRVVCFGFQVLGDTPRDVVWTEQ